MQVCGPFLNMESLLFDLYYYAGAEYQQAKQQKSLLRLENALYQLGKWLKTSCVSLKLVSMRPLPHNPAIFDCRNGRICAINERLCRFCIDNGVKNASTYIGSALSTYGIARLSDSIGWNSTVFIWFLIAFSGVLLCALCIPKWKKEFCRDDNGCAVD